MLEHQNIEDLEKRVRNYNQKINWTKKKSF